MSILAQLFLNAVSECVCMCIYLLFIGSPINKLVFIIDTNRTQYDEYDQAGNVQPSLQMVNKYYNKTTTT